MREHQIVISLKPEQFQEVQRLARAAGARSIGQFVKERLIALLKLEGGPDTSHAELTEGTVDQVRQAEIKVVTSELNRLHKELKVFVEESLASDRFAGQMTVQAGGRTIVAKEENFLSDGVPLVAENSWEYGSEPFLPESMVPFQSTPFGGPAPPELNMGDPLQAQDEFEDLADRAFAISPRLGTIAAPARGSLGEADPLADLLENELLAQASTAEDLSNIYEEEPEEEALDEAAETLAAEEDQEVVNETIEDPPEESGEDPSDSSSPGRHHRKPTGPQNSPFSGGPPPKRRQK